MPETVTGTAADQTPAEKPIEAKPEANGDGRPNGEERRDQSKGPQPGNPRWEQVYARWKDTERELEAMKTKQKEHSEEWEIVREHNRKLETELEALKKTKADKTADPEPDFEVDPGAWRKWKAHQDAIKDKEHMEELDKTRMDTLLTVEKRIHPDYVEMAKIAERDCAKDAELKKRIYNSDNPFAEAYEYGRKKTDEMKDKEKEEAQRQENREKLDVEKGGGHEEDNEPEEEKLSAPEKNVAHKLYPELEADEAEARYFKSKNAMAKKGRQQNEKR